MRVCKRPDGGHSFEGDFTWRDLDQAIAVFQEKGIAVVVRRVVGWRSTSIAQTLDRLACYEGERELAGGRTGQLPAWER